MHIHIHIDIYIYKYMRKGGDHGLRFAALVGSYCLNMVPELSMECNAWLGNTKYQDHESPSPRTIPIFRDFRVRHKPRP